MNSRRRGAWMEMDIEVFREDCLSRRGATETMPFGPDTLVFKVGGKIFAIASLETIPSRVSLKCDPERGLDLRDRYESVTPGYHLSKKHWNTIELGGDLPAAEVRRLIAHSYELVVAALPKAARAELLEE